jgi:hypothetical protein
MNIQDYKAILLAQGQEKTLQSYCYLNKMVKKSQIVLAGSSLMEFFPVNELVQ